MKLKKICLCLFLAGFLFSCQNKNKVHISGEIENGYGYYIKLKDPYKRNQSVIDSVEINKKGKFNFKIPVNNVRFLELELARKSILLIVKPGEEIRLFSHADDFNTYEITGSDLPVEVKTLSGQLRKVQYAIDSLIVQFKAVEALEDKDSIENWINVQFEEHRKYIVKYILQDLKSPANIVALYQRLNDETYFLNTLKHLQYFKIVDDTLSKYYAGEVFVKSLNRDTKDMLQTYHRARLLSMAKEVKTTVPEIKLPDSKGDSLLLSGLKGKVALLNFWSPQEASSISYNNQLKSVYNKYRKQGFEVFSVSFERDVENWKNKVRFEEYNWKTVNDENAQQSLYYGLYNVSGIPSSYLIDPTQEKILAKNIAIHQLDLKLNYELNKNKGD